MRFRQIQCALFAAAALASSPSLAADDYALPVLAGAVAYSETTSEGEWEGQWDGEWDGEGEVIYLDDLDEGEEWRSDDGTRRVHTVIRRDVAPQPGLSASQGTGGHTLGYGEAERAAWLGECRARMSSAGDYAVDSCSDYLARYEAGAGSTYGYGGSYGHDGHAARGCGSCGGGCGCGCSVSYRFVPAPPMPVVQQQKKIRRTITTEEWVEETPGKTVRVITTPTKTVPVKRVPARPAPVKTTQPLYSK